MAILEQELEKHLRQAIKDRHQVKLATLRLLKAAIERVKKEGRQELSDEDIIKIIRSEIKKRKEAIEAFKQGGRAEKAQQESEEMEILAGYLPPEISEAELGQIVDKIIAANSFGQKDFGQAMKLVMAETKGQVDGSRVSALVKQKLTA
ncbi:MAG TPA: GatB/YqeY domain-containing protein [Patescibacteria group bacterium]|nr:GatB/YqeY domain-containing protein [Patescibacteria group bacterium]